MLIRIAISRSLTRLTGHVTVTWCHWWWPRVPLRHSTPVVAVGTSQPKRRAASTLAQWWVSPQPTSYAPQPSPRIPLDWYLNPRLPHPHIYPTFPLPITSADKIGSVGCSNNQVPCFLPLLFSWHRCLGTLPGMIVYNTRFHRHTTISVPAYFGAYCRLCTCARAPLFLFPPAV